jgi:DNA sulfur modification protein DndB
MVPYLLHSDDHFYSALTVEIRPTPLPEGPGSVAFTPKESFPGGPEFGMLTLDGTETLCALDGQHRLKSIEYAIRQKPELAREHIGLILVPFSSVARSQTLFSDLNRYAKAASKSTAILFTHRESLARVAKALAHEVPLLRDRVNMESTSLSSNSRHFITLSTLYEMTRMLAGESSESTEPDEAALQAELTHLWISLTDTLPEWRSVAQGQEHPAYLRQRYLHMHGVGQQGIAQALAAARAAYCSNWKHIVPALANIDWQLANPEWQGVALHGGRVNNTTTSVRLLAQAIQAKLCL